MLTAMKQFKDENPVVLFSGDCVSPSTSEGDHSCGCRCHVLTLAFPLL